MSARAVRRPRLAAAAVLAVATSLPAVVSATAAVPHLHRTVETGRAGVHRLTIQTLSVRADLVSGPQVLTRIGLPGGAVARDLSVRLNGHDVTSEFADRPDHQVEGLLRPLHLGSNRVVATAAGETAALRVTDHPVGGPDFSGPQIQPWRCQRRATDAKCDQRSYVRYFYLPAGTKALSAGVTGVAAANAFLPYDRKSPPARSLIATATTVDHVEVPFIVREENGYIDRDQYAIATLWRPGKQWKPWAPQRQFNHRLVITHGASCDTTYGTGPAPGVLDPKILNGGFVVMSNALDNAGHNCNIVTQAESLLMTKQHVIDHYGPVLWTIGTGCSGGSLTQQQVANAYPGIYQGITPQCSFTDAWSSAMEYVDYTILLKYFKHPATWAPGAVWTPTGIQQVIDHPNIGNPVTFTTVIPNSADPSRSCPDVPEPKVYNARTNPHGVKCTLQDYMVNVFGKKANGFANRAFGDNGIQYGLSGLLNGEITPATFVDLNKKVGGLTYQDTYRVQRSTPDLIGVKRAYRSGAVDTASNLNRVAIIDLRGPDPGFFHDVYRTYAMRARLLRDFGTAANQVLWRGQAPIIGDITFADAAVFAMDHWLRMVHGDDRAIPLPRKIIQDRPSDLTDRCTDGAGTDVPALVCDQTVQVYGTPRMSAGMPMSDDILDCHLKPLRKSDYPVKFTAAQWGTLHQVFPHGVCNYNRPSIGFRKTTPWLTYQKADGHVIYGGRPLGPPPRSHLFD